jgi:formylglycine-generating enzyme required for sulfatase activity
MMEPMLGRNVAVEASVHKRKIRLLFLSANPAGTTRLALDREVREITQRLRATPYYERFELIQEWAVQVNDLQATFLRHAPQIVHFSGHGLGSSSSLPASETSRDVQCNIESDVGEAATVKGGEILVEDAHCKPIGVSAEALTELLRLVGSVRCVVLNACYSASQCAALCEQADCVIGMSKTIADSAAITFAWAFYQALGYGESVEAAFEFGRNQLALGKLPGAELPELMLRGGVAADQIRLVDPVHHYPRRIVLGILVSLAVLGGMIGYYIAGWGTSAAIGAERYMKTVADVSPTPPPGMAWIPPANAVLGTTDAELRELREQCPSVVGKALCSTYDKIGFWDREPRRRAHVDGFFLDRAEVTAREMVAWLAAAGVLVRGEEIELDGVVVARAGSVIEVEHTGLRSKSGFENLPVIDVTWQGARLFCGSRGATLPTGVQWERAARGADGALWPWGNDLPACSDAVLMRLSQECSSEPRMQLIDHTRRDQTQDHVLDLIGNVSEWVLDAGPSADLHEVRGGSYASTWLQARPAARVYATASAPDVGFRCAKGSP